jgi:hypothetical protein
MKPAWAIPFRFDRASIPVVHCWHTTSQKRGKEQSKPEQLSH